MKLSIELGADAELRAQVRAVLLEEVKNISRGEAEKILTAEFERKIKYVLENDWRINKKAIEYFNTALQTNINYLVDQARMQATTHVWEEFCKNCKIDWNDLVKKATERLYNNIDVYVDSRIKHVLSQTLGGKQG